MLLYSNTTHKFIKRGHKSYVPNMISGAAQADIGVLVISARKGEFETGYERGGQTREHVQLAKTLGAAKLLVVVNKMDDHTVNWSKERYDEIESKMTPFLRSSGYNVKKGIGTVLQLFLGDVLKLLESITMPIIDKFKDMGTVVMEKVESGSVLEGDSLLVMPNKAQVNVLSVYFDENKVRCAGPGENLRVRLSGIEEDDILSGFVLSSVVKPIAAVAEFTAQLQILELLENAIFTAGYKAVLHIHSVVEECEIVELLQEIDPKTKKPMKKKVLFVKNGAVVVCRIQVETKTSFSLLISFPLERERKKQSLEMEESFPMTGGDGPYSYAKNSKLQKEAAVKAKSVIVEAIIEKLEVEDTPSIASTFRIADLGCSTGPNTFFSVNTIIEAVTHKYKTKGHSSLPDFQVHFNDHVSNDFNMLFNSLPPGRQYFVSGVPGSFHSRLFPKASLHFVCSAYALQWLSRVPQELSDINSPAYNRGRIFYSNAPNEVGKAYTAQYAMDMERFLVARSKEIVPGGLMALLIPGRPDGTLPAESSIGPIFQTLESCLVDMANEKNGSFSIARLESNTGAGRKQLCGAGECRSGLENIIVGHFGSDIVEELFERYTKKIAELPPLDTGETSGIGLCIILKRNH
ncbi:Translational (tr)-type GTP-binding domain - like 7 [Theobroma cacao]|nr:Translational (tr)-type GTP-binding domain - like 7 [Theobroma cacao]